MSEILSQSEIDELLSAMQSGEVDVEAIKNEEVSKKIRVYDFRRPDKFSKDQLNTIEVMYENFCRLFSTLLSGMLRTRVITKVVSVDQVTYEEFIRSIPNPTILNVFSILPLKGKGILEINPVIGFCIIDRLFGGPGFSTNKGRPLTEIEKGVIEKVVDKILFLFVEAWSSIGQVDPLLEAIEMNPQFAQVVSPAEMVIIISINTKIGETEGLVNICLPCLMLESVANKLNTKFWFASSQSSLTDDNKRYLKNIVERTSVSISAILAKNNVRIKDLLGLQIGDVISFEKKKNSDVEVCVGSKLKFYGRPGVVDGKMAVEITKSHKEEGYDIE
ncbi:MAG: flagellar motor switch protein FliM [Clostridia bacterium]|nr:flagellar motor switch protein FliM [Clostridia bacterium]MDD4047618.1 flagellar motor switch protein FliM [Clostridia bacterium]